MPARTITFDQDRYYHIYNRGVARQSIFVEAENYIFLLRHVKQYARELQLALIAYGLLPNHYHFLVRQDGAAKAGLLPQLAFNRYSKAFNRRYGHSGTLFEGRFKAKPVESEAYLLQLCRYIHANPVKHGLVRSPDEWPYSNYLEWMKERPGTLVDHEFVDGYFPKRADYAEFVRDYLLEWRDLPADIREYLADLP
jgi:putative transposase